MQRSRLFVGLCLAAIALAGCGGRRAMDSLDDMVVEERADGTRIAVRPGRDPNAAYIQATDLKAKGDCATAITLLHPVARLGPGYENAQTALGECLVLKDDGREEGLTWLTRAADAGWPEAQASLAVYFGRDTPTRKSEEAAYWLALYDANTSKARVGFRAPDAAILGAVRGSLTETERASGQRRAATWQRKLWLPPADAEGGPGLRPEGRERRGFRPPPEL
jgi:TPR repeat protein